MAIIAEPVTGHAVLSGVSWTTYEALQRDLECGGTRLTYCRGVLEIMSPSNEHEGIKKALARMIEAMTEELGIPIRSAGSTTFKDQARDEGIEPDESYYVANEPQVRGRSRLDFDRDPPPDLAIEVVITAKWIDKQRLYANLGVPEIWQHDGTALTILRLQPDGSYAERRRSEVFPFLPLDEFQRFLARRDETDETSWIRSFRAWVRGLERGRHA
jgi:Uma2 family endonuclease